MSVTGGDVQFGTGFFWDSNNNRLGIGTSSPTYDIDIEKTFAGDNFLKVSNPSTNALARSGVILYTTDNVSPAIFGKAGQNNPAYKIIAPKDAFFFSGGGANNNDFAFLIDKATGRIKFAAGGSTTAQMTIGANGNVLINTTTDAGFKLDVNGTARVATNLFFDRSYATTFHGFNGNSRVYIAAPATNVLSLYTDDVQRIRIAATGNVLINTTTDAGFRLDVNGTARIVGNVTHNGNVTFRDNVNIADTGQIYRSSGPIALQSFAGVGNNQSVLINMSPASTSISNVAILAASSTTKGFLPPRMTTTEKNAIASPLAGLMVYDTTLNLISVYNGTIWISL
jgi:hypothetical protein